MRSRVIPCGETFESTARLEILLHDPAVYAANNVWSATVEAPWAIDEAAFAAL